MAIYIGLYMKEADNVWTVVYVAPNRPIAEMIKGFLKEEGILSMLRPIGTPHYGESANVEILVSNVEAEEATQIIQEFFGI
jgi:hypothetical protein